MNDTSFLGLVQNAALLLTIAFIFDVTASRWRTGHSFLQQISLGLAIGTIGVTVMMTPWTFMPGIVFDTRSVLIGISGLFFGSLSAAIAMAMTIAFRFYQGGTGAWTGVAVILTSGLIGIAWRHFRRRPLADISWRQLYLFGMVIHLAMLALMLTLPWATALRVLSSISLPVMLIYPMGTALLGVLMVNRLQRERVEEELRESQEIFNQFMENSPIYVFFKDDQIRAVRLSRNYEKMLGKPIAELLGKTMDELFPSDLAKRMVADDLRTLNEGKQVSIEEELNGRVYTTIKFPIQYEGKLRYLAGYTIDITESRRIEEEKRSLEERLHRAEKMEALGTLAGGVAHDLNNVLGIVVGYSEMLLDGVDDSSPLRRGLENIMSGGMKAAAIVDDLLTLARRGVPGRQVLNLNKIIADNQKSPEWTNLSFRHPSVKIEIDLEPDLLNISGSSVHLGKSLYNLISNASEAMSKGGRVTIKTTNQYLDRPIHGYDQIREGDYVVLAVSDMGEGIHDDDLKRIFEPFYTKKIMGRSGTGLGLAVVWGTVKDHHGYINVASEEGKGSTFTLYFPVTREDIAAEGIAVPISEYMGNGESILIVDDTKEQRDLAAGILGKLNYKVVSVSSGEGAVGYMREHEVDLIVLDMVMDPGMDGLDTYRIILDIRPKQKAIIVSGFSESDRVHAARDLGAGPYVRKPYTKEKLGVAVKKELERST